MSEILVKFVTTYNQQNPCKLLVQNLPFLIPLSFVSLTICMASSKATIMLHNESVIICETHGIFITQDLKSAIFFGF